MDLRAHLLAALDRAYDLKSWHGPNLKGSLRGVSPAVAFFRPGPERHSIYDLVLHAAYWKYVVRRRLSGEKRGSFALRALVEELPEHAFAARFGRWTGEAVISGAAAHDLYHAGQIQLLRKLAEGHPARTARRSLAGCERGFARRSSDEARTTLRETSA